MKTSLLPCAPKWICIALLALVGLSPAVRADQTHERSLSGKISAATRTVRIDHRLGPVNVVGVDADFGWAWTMRVTSGTSSDGEAYLKDCELEVMETAGTLELRLNLPESRDYQDGVARTLLGIFSRRHHGNLGSRSELQLRLPRAVAVELKNRFGTTTVSALTGPVHVTDQNGRVELRDLSGAVTAVTSFASLHAEHLGMATLQNQNGSIEATDIGGDFRAGTSFGRMVVRNVKGRTDLKNQNGGIEVSGVEGDVFAQTSFARLVADGINGHADLKNQNGAIEARQVTGNLVAATSFADLRVSDIGGKASLTCKNGRVDATRVGDDLRAANTFAAMRVQEVRGTADLESQNGDVTAIRVDGDVRAKTSFGRMDLDGSGKRFDARNQNGAVSITARSPAVERIAATASFAAIDVRLPGELQPVIRASTSFGKVRSEYPVLMADTFSDAKFHADSNQPKIELKGQNGDIRIQSLATR